VTYELALPDGRILRTRISHPPDRTTYGPGLWAHILRDQLDVDQETFWALVRDGVRPARGTPPPRDKSVPLDVVAQLVSRVGLPEAEVRTMTREQAIARLTRFWTEGT